jgi:hypothetical protein
MNKEKLLSIINKYVGYAEEEIYNAVAEYEEEKISFAKKHCEAALKAASEKANTLKGEVYASKGAINKESILYSYPLENIK